MSVKNYLDIPITELVQSINYFDYKHSSQFLKLDTKKTITKSIVKELLKGKPLTNKYIAKTFNITTKEAKFYIDNIKALNSKYIPEGALITESRGHYITKDIDKLKSYIKKNNKIVISKQKKLLEVTLAIKEAQNGARHNKTGNNKRYWTNS